MLLALSIIGIFSSVILLYYNARKYSSSVYLGLFFLITSWYGFSQYALFISKSVFLILLSVQFVSFFYLIGPLLLWYIRSILRDDSRLKVYDLIHFLPFVVHFLFMVPYLFSSWSHKSEIAEALVDNVSYIREFKFTALSRIFSVRAMFISRPLLVFGYTLWASGIYVRHLLKSGRPKVFVKQNFMYKWMLFLLVFQLILVTSHLLLMLKPFSEFMALNLLQVLSGFGMIGLMLSPFFFPMILYGLPRLPTPVSGSVSLNEIPENEAGQSRKYMPFLSADYLEQIQNKTEKCMKELQPYLNQDCNLAYFSKIAGIPVHHLAYYFREERKQTFNDYRNHWRVMHAKNLISQGKAREMTLEAIGLLSGFSTRNTFFNVFKKTEGISPGAYAGQFPE